MILSRCYYKSSVSLFVDFLMEKCSVKFIVQISNLENLTTRCLMLKVINLNHLNVNSSRDKVSKPRNSCCELKQTQKLRSYVVFSVNLIAKCTLKSSINLQRFSLCKNICKKSNISNISKFLKLSKNS